MLEKKPECMHCLNRRRKALLWLPHLDLFHNNKRRVWNDMDMDIIKLPRKNILVREIILQNSVIIMHLFRMVGATVSGSEVVTRGKCE